MSARAVIFDMDGLLLDTEPLYKRAWQHAVGRLGFELNDDTFHSFTGMSDSDSEDALRRELGPTFPLERFRRLWPHLWEQGVRTHGVVAKPGITTLLDALAEHEVPSAVATSSPSARAHHALRAAGIAEYFTVVVSCESVGRAKPAPDVFLEAAAQLGFSPGDCVVLEDSDVGARAAAAAGMCVIVIPDLRDPSTHTREIAEAVHESAALALPTLRRLLAS